MKKFFICLGFIVSFIGCNPEAEIADERQVVSVEEDKFDSALEDVYGQAISIAMRQKPINKIDQIKNFGIYVYDSRKASESFPDSINNLIFGGKGPKFLKSARTSGIQSVPLTPSVAMINAEIANSPYTTQQKEKLTQLVNDVFAPADPLAVNYGETIAWWKATVILTSSFTSNQKKELQNYGTMISTIFNFVKNGGIDYVYNEITASIPEYSPSRTGRTTGCSINTRNVLIGALYNGVKGAVSGGIYGAAGGTFTVPGFGTVGGAVGGAVLGGATAFAWGLVDGVATELLSTCTRNIRNENASCQEVLNNFMAGSSSTKSYLMNTFPNCFKLDLSNLVMTPTQANAEAIVITNASGSSWLY